MKKHLTKSRVIAYLTLLAAVTLVVTAVTYSRYQTKINGNAVASVAAWESEVGTISLDVSGLVPGGEKTFEFQVSNEKDGKVSEVSQEYSITVKTTGNLPLTFQLEKNTDSTETDGTYVTTGKIAIQEGSGSAAGGQLPHSKRTVHQYVLKACWPADETDTRYADEIDMVTLCVDAHQMEPTT